MDESSFSFNIWDDLQRNNIYNIQQTTDPDEGMLIISMSYMHPVLRCFYLFQQECKGWLHGLML